MKGGKSPLGYTIIEVMVVLAVSGVMFLIATTFVNGKQARTAFSQGINDLAGRLQAVASQVSDGQFTDVSLNTCKPQGGTLFFDPSSTNGQGTNNQCVFLGKLVYFYKNGTSEAENYAVINLANALNDPVSNNPVTTLGTYVAGIDSLTTQNDVPQSLDVTHMRINGGGGDNFSLGFVQGLGTTDNSGEANHATYQSGSQSVSMVYGPALTSTSPLAPVTTHAFTSAKVNGQVSLASKAELCVTDGNRRAIITMDIQNDGLNADVRHLTDGSNPCW